MKNDRPNFLIGARTAPEAASSAPLQNLSAIVQNCTRPTSTGKLFVCILCLHNLFTNLDSLFTKLQPLFTKYGLPSFQVTTLEFLFTTLFTFLLYHLRIHDYNFVYNDKAFAYIGYKLCLHSQFTFVYNFVYKGLTLFTFLVYHLRILVYNFVYKDKAFVYDSYKHCLLSYSLERHSPSYHGSGGGRLSTNHHMLDRNHHKQNPDIMTRNLR